MNPTYVSVKHDDFFAKIPYAAIDESVTWTSVLKHKETGEEVRLKRSMSYVATNENIYYYDKFELPVQRWSQTLWNIKIRLANHVDTAFNSVLLNKYKDGKDKINWHSDKEDQLGPDPTIACVNFGATRKFHFLEKETGIKEAITVSHGDVLVMWGGCQARYLHAILPEKEVKEPRISLTFRRVIQ